MRKLLFIAKNPNFNILAGWSFYDDGTWTWFENSREEFHEDERGYWKVEDGSMTYMDRVNYSINKGNTYRKCRHEIQEAYTEWIAREIEKAIFHD